MDWSTNDTVMQVNTTITYRHFEHQFHTYEPTAETVVDGTGQKLWDSFDEFGRATPNEHGTWSNARQGFSP